jgi:hypothetical protein
VPDGRRQPHLGYKEVLNALEDRSPGSKAAFLFGFLERGHERFADDAATSATSWASAPCAVARRPATCARSAAPDTSARSTPARSAARRRWPRRFAAGDRVLLVDAKRRRHLVTLAAGASSTRTPGSSRTTT